MDTIKSIKQCLCLTFLIAVACKNIKKYNLPRTPILKGQEHIQDHITISSRGKLACIGSNNTIISETAITDQATQRNKGIPTQQKKEKEKEKANKNNNINDEGAADPKTQYNKEQKIKDLDKNKPNQQHTTTREKEGSEEEEVKNIEPANQRAQKIETTQDIAKNRNIESKNKKGKEEAQKNEKQKGNETGKGNKSKQGKKQEKEEAQKLNEEIQAIRGAIQEGLNHLETLKFTTFQQLLGGLEGKIKKLEEKKKKKQEEKKKKKGKERGQEDIETIEQYIRDIQDNLQQIQKQKQEAIKQITDWKLKEMADSLKHIENDLNNSTNWNKNRLHSFRERVDMINQELKENIQDKIKQKEIYDLINSINQALKKKNKASIVDSTIRTKK